MAPVRRGLSGQLCGALQYKNLARDGLRLVLAQSDGRGVADGQLMDGGELVDVAASVRVAARGIEMPRFSILDWGGGNGRFN